LGNLLAEKDSNEIKKHFEQQLINPVTLRLFVQDPNEPGECMYCSETEQICREVAELSDKINLTVHSNSTSEQEQHQKYGIERVPALILEKVSGTDSGVRFYGIPSGYEFGTLIEDITELSTGESKISTDLRKQVEQIQQDVTIKVFVTPT